MKRTKTMIAIVLLLSLLLFGCTQAIPKAAVGEITPKLAVLSGQEAQAVFSGEATPTYVQNTIFNAKFEGDAVEGSGEAVDGVYRFAATKTDGEAWHVKLECNYPTISGHDYRVTYRFNSDVAGKIKFGDFQEFDIQKGENSVCGIVIATGGTTYLDLQLGMLPPFTIDFTEIEVEEAADEVEYEDALSAPVNFEKEAIVYENHDEGYDTKLTRGSDEISINYTSVPSDAGVWKSKLFVETGLKPEKGTHYRITADVSCDQDMAFEVLLNNDDEEKGYGALYEQKLSAGEVKTCEAVIIGTNGGKELVLQFSFGEAPKGSTINVSNLHVEKIIDHYTNMLADDFALDKVMNTGRVFTYRVPDGYTEIPLDSLSFDGTDTVYEGHDNDYVVNLEESSDSATLNITQAPAEDRGVWKAKLFAATGVTLEAGESYIIKYDITATKDQAEYEACFDGDSENTYGALYGLSLTGGTTETVEYMVTPSESHGPLTIRLQLGKTDTTEGNSVTINNVQVLKCSGETATELDLTGFTYPAGEEAQEEAHSFELEANSGAAATLTGTGDSAIATVTKPGDDWHVKLYAKPGLELEAGETYMVSMKVTGASGCTACYKNTATGDEEGFGKETIVDGTVTHTVTPSENGTLEILLKIGNVAADTQVTVSEVKIEKAGTDYDPVDFDFAYPVGEEDSTVNNSFDLSAENGAAATLTGNGSSATATVTTPGDDWHVKLYAKPGLELEAGTLYMISLNVSGAAGCTVCFKNTATGNEEGFGKETISDGTITHTVSPTESGTLEIVLKIGNVEAGTEVTVSDIKIGKEDVDFIPLELSGFAYPVIKPASTSDSQFLLETNEGTKGTLTGDGASATATITKPGDDWHVKLYAFTGITLEKGATYQISMNVSGAAGCTACYKNGTLGQEEGFGTEQIVDGLVTHTVTASENGTLEILLKIGNVAVNTNVTVSGIKIEKLEPSYTDVTVNRGFFLENNEGAQAETLAVDANSTTVKITKPGDDWHIKLYVQQNGLTLKKGKTYRISMNVTGAAGCEAAFKSLANYDEHGFGYIVPIPDGLVTHLITPDEDAGFEVVLKLGALAEGAEVTVSDIKVEEVENAFTEISLTNFAYPASTPAVEQKNSFDLTAENGAAATLSGEGNDATATIETSGDDWHVKFYAFTGVELEKGKTYKVNLTVSGASGCTVCYKNGTTFNEEGFGTEIVSESTVTHEISPEENGKLEILIKIGNLAAGSQVTISNVEVYEYKLGIVDITPESFAYPVTTAGSVTKNNFDLEANEGTAATLSGTEDSASATVTKPGDDWHVKFYVKPGITLEKGKTYRISMDVSGAAGCMACYKNTNSGDEEGFGKETIADGTVTHSVTANENGGLEILLKIGNVAAGTKVTVSNVKVSELQSENEDITPEDFTYPPQTEEVPTGSSFELEANSGAEAALSGDGKSAIATVTKPGDDWHVKLYAKPGIELEAGKTYRISMNVTGAEGCTACYKNTATGDEEGFGSESITDGLVSHTVAVTENGVMEILLKIGNVPAGTEVVVSDVKIEEISFGTSENILSSISYDSIGSISYAADNGYIVEVDKNSDSAEVNILQAPEEGRNPWNMKLFVRTGFKPEEGKGYRVSFDIESAKKQGMFEVFYDGGSEAAYGALYNQSLAGGKQTVSYEFLTDASTGELVLQIRLGKTDGTDGNSYTISNVKLEEISYKTSNVPETQAVTVLWAHEDYSATMEKAPSKVTVKIDKVPAEGKEPWKTKLFVYTLATLEAGQKYRISFEVKSTIAENFEICFNNGEEEKGLGAMYGLTLSPSGKYIEYVTYAKQNTNLVIQLSLGTLSASNSVTIENVQVTKAGQVNLISDTIYTFK